jgi:hypothetical protein
LSGFQLALSSLFSDSQIDISNDEN